MIWWQNRILTNVALSLGDKCKNISSTINKAKAVFPACAVQTIYNNAIADDLDYDSDGENAVFCGIAIDVFSKKNLAHAIELIGIVNTAMYRMGFKRSQGVIEVKEEDSPDIFHVAARYTRVIGADDVIDRFET